MTPPTHPLERQDPAIDDHNGVISTEARPERQDPRGKTREARPERQDPRGKTQEADPRGKTQEADPRGSGGPKGRPNRGWESMCLETYARRLLRGCVGIAITAKHT
ncbi:hypothetical protein K469DRAFT_179711 [Zopfia rhizophila CBS 207.26]|uniref:Uncharacterized protein n=1 Tax=Zopfia rhizophila CBS 207.26 TaxID=1314779 RepID=A0A6A6DZP6_9PEZI|nr:hypothetical protein K469DRAFT_179711 [Zopfia rhizophila CBS 207.26]